MLLLSKLRFDTSPSGQRDTRTFQSLLSAVTGHDLIVPVDPWSTQRLWRVKTCVCDNMDCIGRPLVNTKIQICHTI